MWWRWSGDRVLLLRWWWWWYCGGGIVVDGDGVCGGVGAAVLLEVLRSKLCYVIDEFLI